MKLVTNKLHSRYAEKDCAQTFDVVNDDCRRVEAAADLGKLLSGEVKQQRNQPFGRYGGATAKETGGGNQRNRGDGETNRRDNNQTCHRCGRNNHLVKDCVANKYLDGLTVMKPHPASNVSTPANLGSAI